MMSEPKNGRKEINVQVSLGGADESGEFALVLALHVLEGNNGGSLLVDDRAKTGLALDDNVGNTHLATESRQEDDKLDRVNIVSDDNEVRLLGLDKSNNVVEAVLDEKRLLGLLYICQDHA